MGLIVLLLLSLIWVTWVARILAAHWSRPRWDAARVPPLSGGDDFHLEAWWGSMESLEPVEASAPEGVTAGTIEAMDPVGLSLVLHTDDAQLKYLVLPDARMLEGLTHGDRILLCRRAGGRPWLLHKVEPGFREALRQPAGEEEPAEAPVLEPAAVRQAGLERLAG